jgi:hypothetical protein
MSVGRLASELLSVARSVLAADNPDVWRMSKSALRKEEKLLADLAHRDYWEFYRGHGSRGLNELEARHRLHLIQIALGKAHPPWKYTYEEFDRVHRISEQAYIKNVKDAIKRGYPVPKEVREQEML